ncbi:MAG: HD domain-containing protein [Candidatus Diapherotrites archaeon]
MSENLIEFFHLAGKLKETKRTGWVLSGVSEPESVSDHSFRMAVMAMVLAPRFKLDELKLLKMVLVHDLAEGITGDIVSERNSAHRQMDWSQKIELEEKALNKVANELGPAQAKEIVSLWKEYEEGKSKEAKFAKDLDQLEKAFQASEYEKAKNHSKSLDEFYTNTENKFSNAEIKKLFQKLLDEKSRK